MLFKLYWLSFNNEKAYLRTFRPEGSSVRNGRSAALAQRKSQQLEQHLCIAI